MNDRFLFRGKRIDDGEWITGSLYITETDAIITTALSTYADGFMQAFGSAIEPDTVSQCTGLSDKNGTLIFEGDIIKLCDTNPILFVVSIECKKYGWACVFRYADNNKIDTAAFLDKCEIIGNIYDNPKLEISRRRYETRE